MGCFGQKKFFFSLNKDSPKYYNFLFSFFISETKSTKKRENYIYVADSSFFLLLLLKDLSNTFHGCDAEVRDGTMEVKLLTTLSIWFAYTNCAARSLNWFGLT